MQNSLKIVLTLAGCALAFNVLAETVVDEVWTCKVKEGKTIEDVYAANEQWVAHMNGALDVGEIKSGTVTPIVGDQGQFLFVDTYPNLAAWAKADEYQNSDAGEAAMEAIDDALEAAADCDSNRLYKYTSN